MKILLIEDHAELRRMTAAHLSERGFVVDVAANLADARAALEVSAYDALVLDLGLPDGDGVEILSSLRRSKGPPALILTARDQLEDRIGGLNAGADDYMVKPFELGELEARLRAILRRPGGREAPILAFGDLTFDTAHWEAACEGRNLDLRRREALLLESLIKNQGRIVVRDVLEERLYSFAEPVTPNALEACVSRLRRTLAEAGSRVVIEARRGIGYLLRDPGPPHA